MPLKKCAECGYLMRRKEGKLEPCDDTHRGPSGFDPQEHGDLHCSKLAYDLNREWTCEVGQPNSVQHPALPQYPGAAVAVLHANRRCKLWLKWNPLLTPKEHEMQHVVDAAQRNARWSLLAAIFSPIFAAWLTWYLTGR